MNYKTIIYVIAFGLMLLGFNQKPQLPEGFVYVSSVIPDLDVELRYFSENNFVGDTIDGYNANKLILTKEATEKMKLVHEELQEQNLCLQLNSLFLF